MFGADAAAYAAGRPGYPREVFDVLTDRCGLAPGTATLEIGPGAGQATAELVRCGADPLVLVEPDPALAAFLAERFGDRVEVRRETFEAMRAPAGAFRLAASATAFHWIDPTVGLGKVAHLLSPGGWWAAWWTAFHDPDRRDELEEALTPILGHLSSYRPETVRTGGMSDYSFDRDARVAELVGCGAFSNVGVETFRWALPLDAQRARALFGTFSPILALEDVDRERVLGRIEALIEERFGGRFDRTAATVLYTARRRAEGRRAAGRPVGFTRVESKPKP